MIKINWEDEAYRMQLRAEAALDLVDELKITVGRLRKALETIRDIGTAEVMKIANDALRGEDA